MSGPPRTVLGVTVSACPQCRRPVPARVEADGAGVRFRKFCPEHGESAALVRADPEDYRRTLRYVKPAWRPRAFAGDARVPCPEGCGFCERHEQHLCMPIVEITDRCDLHCPCCINDSGAPGRDGHLDRAAFARILDALLAAEGQIDVLTLSGGEPLLHPGLAGLLDEALGRRDIVRVSVSTNGLALLSQPPLLEMLRSRGVVVSLQMDGFDDGAYRVLRGRALAAGKRAILDLLKAADITTSLTMTAAAGVNDSQFGALLGLLFGEPHIVSLMVQPLAFAGRAAALAGRIGRLSIPDVVRAIAAAGHPGVAAGDFVPLPCSHPLCFSLAFYLVDADGKPVSVGALTDAATMLDCLANRVFFGLHPEEHERMKQLVYRVWSGPAALAPDSQALLHTLRALLRAVSGAATADGFDARKVFTAAERRVKSIFIHAFQDADTFDLSRVRRCCQAYPLPDGRLVPACVRNVLWPMDRAGAQDGPGGRA